MSARSLLFVVLVAVGQAAHAGGFQRYDNARYGFSMMYPSDFTMEQPPPDNGDGRRFLKYRTCVVLAFGANNVLDETLQSLERDHVKKFEKITGRSRGRGWFALSGTTKNQRLFIKTYVGSKSINELRVEQPMSGKPCSVNVRAVALGFHPGPLNEAH